MLQRSLNSELAFALNCLFRSTTSLGLLTDNRIPLARRVSSVVLTFNTEQSVICSSQFTHPRPNKQFDAFPSPNLTTRADINCFCGDVASLERERKTDGRT